MVSKQVLSDDCLKQDLECLKERVDEKNITLSPESWHQLNEYAELLYFWSGRMNLVSREDRGCLGTKHLLAALMMLPVISVLPVRILLDVGSGGGLPGIPLKIALPKIKIYLLESRRRRVSFLREVVRRLGLKKVEVVNCRLEEWNGPRDSIDLITSRAVARPEKLLTMVRPFLSPHGNVLTSLSTRPRERGGEVPIWRDRSWGLYIG